MSLDPQLGGIILVVTNQQDIPGLGGMGGDGRANNAGQRLLQFRYIEVRALVFLLLFLPPVTIRPSALLKAKQFDPTTAGLVASFPHPFPSKPDNAGARYFTCLSIDRRHGGVAASETALKLQQFSSAFLSKDDLAIATRRVGRKYR